MACLPQAWAAGAGFMMLQACLGLSINAAEGTITVTDPRLPIGIDRLWIDGLEVGELVVNLAFERHGDAIRVVSEAPPGCVCVNRPERG